MRKPDTEIMHIQIHADLAQLPFTGKLGWLIESPPAWRWFLAWAPGMITSLVDHGIWPVHSPLSSASRRLSSLGPQPSSGRRLPSTPCVQPAALPILSIIQSQEGYPALGQFLSEDTDMPAQTLTVA